MKCTFEELMERYPCLEACADAISKAAQMLTDTYKNGGKVLTCGNGGSCADSDHIVGELMKGFLLKRPMPDEKVSEFADLFEDGECIAKNLQGALPAISLTAQSAIVSAFANDVDPELVYAQLVYGYGKAGDVLIGLSTSGNSANVVSATKTAKFMGVKTIIFTGKNQCTCDSFADVVIHVPETETFKVQELHLPVYHYLCAECERQFFNM
ncbi:MAG: SIS domain-containing protein [Clostridia bacterium]|nr:SIS domain-containing protein [Clostridia bacterium]